MLKNKRSAVFSILLFGGALVLLFNQACQKKTESPTLSTKEKASILPTTTHPIFNENVGGPIDSATAKRWKDNLAQKLSKNKSISTPTVYYIHATALQLLISRENNVGVLFYFGKDSAGQVSVIPIGVDNRGYVMPTTTVYTTNGSVSWKAAKEWRNRFRQDYPDGTTPWGYFYGSIAIEKLVAQGNELVRIEFGINDAGSQQILFSNGDVIASPDYYDVARPCQPACAFEEEGL